ncbi:hypothetical protein [Halocola ammonii]
MIKRLLIFLFVCSAAAPQAQTESTVFRGIYQGEVLYVKNPVASSGVGFSVFEVRVNGEITTDEVNSSAFAIDFKAFGLEVGEPVVVELRCKPECTAEVINEEAILPRAQTKLLNVRLGSEGKLTWETENETGNIPFIIEQFRWNKWVVVGKVPGSGNGRKNKYSFTVPMHFGENKVRLKQRDHRGTHFFDVVSVNSQQSSPVEIKRKRVVDVIEFSGKTFFEIYSEYGELITYGFDDEVFVKDVPRGKYYVNFGCQLAETVAKR